MGWGASLVKFRPLVPGEYLQLMRLTVIITIGAVVIALSDRSLAAASVAVVAAAMTVWLWRRFRRS